MSACNASVDGAAFTTTVQVALFVLSSFDVAVIVASPALTAVMTPLSTVATSGLSVVQSTVEFVAFFTVAVSVCVTELLLISQWLLRQHL